MKKTKKYLILSLAASIALSPMAINAIENRNQGEVIPISQPTPEDMVVDMPEEVNVVDEVEIPDYIEYKGEIVEITENQEYNLLSILVKDNKEEEYNGMLFHINKDVILLSDETNDFITTDELEVGMTVTGYYNKDTIMLMSLPPQLGPDALIVNKSEEPGLIHVSKFDDKLISSDGSLSLSISEDTIIIDKDGSKLEKEDITNQDLMVFYTIVRESYPAQTTPEKIILIERENQVSEPEITDPEVGSLEIQVLDKLIINDEEITLDNILYKNQDGVMMLPLREIAEALGYEVTWDNGLQRAELTKGAQWTAVTIGEDSYSFAKMLIKLGTAPELKDSKTYVPFNFLEEVLRVSVDIREEGIIVIQ